MCPICYMINILVSFCLQAEIVKVNHAKMVEVVLSVVQDMSVCVHQDGEATSASKVCIQFLS